MKKSHPLLKSVIIAGVVIALAKTMGFIREIALAAFYGAGTISDAFILACAIPDTLLYFISVSAASSFIPMYHRAEDKTRFTQNIMTCLILIGLLVSVIFTVFPGALVKLFAFQINMETFELAEYFVRYMIWSAIFILLTQIYNARLEIEGKFFSAGMRSVWLNATIIIGIILSAASGCSLTAALAPVAGAALCMFSLAAVCRRQSYTYRPYLDIHSPELKQILLLMCPLFLSTAAVEIKTIIDRNFAALLPVGAISSLNYANKMTLLFIALIGQPLFTVLFPYMSRLAADDDIVHLKSVLTRGIAYIMVITLPICIGVIVLAQPGVRVLFQRGLFTADDTIHTASCLVMYAPILISGSINPLLMRVFYAGQNTRIPAIISIVTLIASITFNFLLMGPLGAKGLALSTSLSSMLTIPLLLVFLRKKLGPLGTRSHLPEFVKLVFAAGVMGAGAWFAANALPLMSVPALQSILLCSALAAAAALVYIVLLLLLKSSIAFYIIIKMKNF